MSLASDARGVWRRSLRRARIRFDELTEAGRARLPPLREDGEAGGYLVICHDVLPRGGLLRFDRAARALQAQGRELAFVSIAESPRIETDLSAPLLDLRQAARRRWSAVMIPGAGFPDAVIPRLRTFRDPRFGARVQHVLNDKSRRDRFLDVARVFAPDLVLFNTPVWTEADHADFAPARCAVLCGAVDVELFASAEQRRRPDRTSRWVVGGLANKNPRPLLEAVRRMRPGAILRLYGPDAFDLARTARKDVADGRLELVGRLSPEALPAFYASVDCVASVEADAGWANLAAEAMACGAPVVCTPHGAEAFALHEKTALVVEAPRVDAIFAALERLRGDPALGRRLAERARETISRFSWEAYAAGLRERVDAIPTRGSDA